MEIISIRKSPIIIPFLADWHTMSTTGLSLPQFMLDDRNVIAQNLDQSFLFNTVYKGLLDETIKLKKILKADILTICTGDLIDNQWSYSGETLSRNQSSMIKHATELIRPFADMSKMMVFLRGTNNYCRAKNEIDELLALNMMNLYPDHVYKLPYANNISNCQFEEYINGVLVNVMHKGRVGLKPWTKINPLISLAQQIIIERTERKAVIPRLVVRANAHVGVDTFEYFRQIRVIQLPCMQLAMPGKERFSYSGEQIIPGFTIIVIMPDSTFHVVTRQFDSQLK